VIETGDGGTHTVRTHIYDYMGGITECYGGRSIINLSFSDHMADLPLEKNKSLYDQYLTRGDEAWGPQGRLVTYAGTVVGLINSVKRAGDVVRELQQDIVRRLNFKGGQRGLGAFQSATLRPVEPSGALYCRLISTGGYHYEHCPDRPFVPIATFQGHCQESDTFAETPVQKLHSSILILCSSKSFLSGREDRSL
jgi:hypothetical protein